MDNEKELLEALNGIRTELQQLNKTIATLASQQNRPPQAGRPASAATRPTQSRPRTEGARTGGYKRAASSDDGELTGYGAEMSARFPKKRGPARPKAKTPASKKGGGYPKKTR